MRPALGVAVLALGLAGAAVAARAVILGTVLLGFWPFIGAARRRLRGAAAR